ncbi:unnamed protein product [Rotaria sordida]|uniref:Uncharacterized protein n=1 Tax=Rotaria sordida TaxID=392033 RepID=A0A813PWG5_9BILA|nr:unnamed protein product [Rotaria sordida]CAF3667409.1 unnamed protein product [Rotaria sordida]
MDKAYDQQLAQHLASWYQYGKESENTHEPMDTALFRDYISHVRTFVSSQVTEAAGKVRVNSLYREALKQAESLYIQYWPKL